MNLINNMGNDMSCCTSRHSKGREESAKKYVCESTDRPEHIFQHYSNYYSNRYIFLPNNQSLIRYDVFCNQARAYDLSIFYKSQFFTSQLIHSTYCLLPNGDIFIVSYSNDRILTFVYNLNYSKHICFGPMNTVRDQISLYYYKGYIYALGGYQTTDATHLKSLKIAERFNLHENHWEILEDMLEERVAPSVIGIGDYIYILGGGTNTAEKYDIVMEKFISFEIEVPFYHFLTFLKEDKVFIVTKDKVIIRNHSFDQLEEKEISAQSDVKLKLVANIIIKQDQVIYYSYPNVIRYNISAHSTELLYEISSSRMRTLKTT